MLDPKTLIKKVKAKHPDRTVDELYDYDINWVLAKAPHSGRGSEFDNLFLVSKGGSAVKPFLPFDAGDTYIRAINSEPIYSVR